MSTARPRASQREKPLQAPDDEKSIEHSGKKQISLFSINTQLKGDLGKCIGRDQDPELDRCTRSSQPQWRETLLPAWQTCREESPELTGAFQLPSQTRLSNRSW